MQWSEDCALAFQDLKCALSSDPALRAPDFSKEFTLQTDASKRGVGAVLNQELMKTILWNFSAESSFLRRKILNRRKRMSSS